MRFHILGLPHTKIRKDLPWAFCAYTQKIHNMCKMLYDNNHEVFLYAHTGSTAPCTKLIDFYPNNMFDECFGKITSDTRTAFNTEVPTNIWARDNFAKEVNKRLIKDDIILAPFGDMYEGSTFKNCKAPVIEMAIGYPNCHFAYYKVWESYYIKNHIDGRNHNEKPNWSETVIHGYIDPEEYIYNPNPRDYFLYMARVEDDYAHSKGLHLALELQAKLGFKLIIAGPGPGEKYVRNNVTYIGPVSETEKALLLSNAKGLFSLSLYPEPFGYIVIESLISGTPVITTDHGAFPETVIEGKTGFRAICWDDLVNAVENINNISRYECRDYALRNFSLEAAYKKYIKYYNKVLQLEKGDWYASFDKNKFEKDWHKIPINRIWTQAGHAVFKKELEIPLNLNNKTIIDVGGGPCSILLQSLNIKKGYIIDPINYIKELPKLRTIFDDLNINFINKNIEDCNDIVGADEIWCYNVLSHVDDLQGAFNSILKMCKPNTIVKIMEPINVGIYEGHPQNLTTASFKVFKSKFEIIKDIVVDYTKEKRVRGEHLALILKTKPPTTDG